MSKKVTEGNTVIDIPPLRQGVGRFRIIGTTPLFQNRMSAKVKQGLLVGSRKKTKVERLDIKHDPFREFVESAEVLATGPTALGLKVVAVKAAMCNAAIETAGLTKAGTQRLLFMPGDYVPLYGIPLLRMDVTRSADMARTPDVRTRAFLETWGAEIEVRYVTPQLSMNTVATLLCNAGILIGVGDFRQEKGKGAFGSFRVIMADQEDEEWNELVANCGRDAQLEALNNPQPYSEGDTPDLLDFYVGERERRDTRIAA